MPLLSRSTFAFGVLGFAFVLGSSPAAAQAPKPPEPKTDADKADAGKAKDAAKPKAKPAPKAPAAEPVDPLLEEDVDPDAEAESPASPEVAPLPAPAKPPAGSAGTGVPGMLPLGPEGGEAGEAAPAPRRGPTLPPDPESDAAALERQPSEIPREGAGRPGASSELARSRSDVYSDSWWSHARPAFEVHGYYRLRAELFHKFSLGRVDPPGSAFWPQPPDQDHIDTKGDPHPIRLCGDDPLRPEPCEATTQAGANMRFRLAPELHISDNVRVLSQIDLLDNLVLGSTPDGYANRAGQGGGAAAIGGGGYVPGSGFASTQNAPASGINSFSDSVAVKRVWGEYQTPLGALRFGRMPHHWGMGIFANAGDGHDSDYQSTVDRILFVTGLKKLDLYFGASWDFPGEGATSASLTGNGTGEGATGTGQGQPYDLAQLDDVAQYSAFVMRKVDPELQKLELAKKKVVVNGGVYFLYRSQFLANDETSDDASAALGQTNADVSRGYVRRNLRTYTPDAWFQLLWDNIRFEFESVLVLGSMENTSSAGGSGTNYENPADESNPGFDIAQFGFASEFEFRAMEDRLKAQFGFGYSSGDDDVDGLVPQGSGIQPQRTADRTYSQYRFHPDYRQDLIFYRHILGRVQGSYYFRPSIEYDFQRDKNGQRLGGNAAAIWSRASEFMQAPGNRRDLGVELDFSLYYQSKDGSLNDGLDRAGGFYTALQYGVFFPLSGLDYLPGERDEYRNLTSAGQGVLDTKTAQTLRWYLGILF